MTLTLTDKITEAFHTLEKARVHGDKLTIELAEAALNDLLGRIDVTPVTRNDEVPSADHPG